MTELTAPSILALFETDKTQRKSFSEKIVNAIKEGEVNPLEAHLQLNGMQDVIDNILVKDPKKNKNADLAKEYDNLLMAEAELHGKQFEKHQAKFSIGEVGVSYDFSVCEDPVLNLLLSDSEILKEKVDFRKNELKTVPPSGRTEVNNETGEVYTIYPPKKTSTTALKVTLR